MKKLYIFVILFLICHFVIAQNNEEKKRAKAIIANQHANPFKRFSSCVKLAFLYGQEGYPDSIPPYTSELFKIAEKQQNDSLLMVAYVNIARYYDYKTDTRAELENLFKAVSIAEKKYPASMYDIYIALAGAYHDIPNDPAAIKHLNFAKKLLPHENIPKSLPLQLYFGYASAYLGMNKIDSALHYIQKTNEILLKEKQLDNNAFVYAITANIYSKLGELRLARNYYERSVGRDVNLRRTYNDAVALDAYSTFLLQQGELVDAARYGRDGLSAAKKSQAKKPFLALAETLRKTYHARNQKDSAYYFARLELAYRDSLYNREKLNAVEDMTINEEIRQREEAIKRTKLATEQHHNTQYAGIAAGLIVFIILLFLSGRTVMVSEKVITFLGVLGLLTVFEFINLLIHPWLEEVTHHSPVLMLAVLVLIGALLVPVHHKMEKWMTHVLLEKNRLIRLAAAKKIVANLEKH